MYVLQQRTLSPAVTLEIPEARYQELKQARAVLSSALAFEQRYELLIGNFIALELALTQVSLRATVEPQYGYSDAARVIEDANRHFVNLLTVMRGYCDQVQQDFKVLKVTPSFKDMAKDELRQAYGRSSDFRFMDSLRNYVQHKATAVHSCQMDAERESDPSSWADAMKFYASKDELSADKDFKLRVLDEQPKKIDLRRSARRAVEEYGAVHISLRRRASGEVSRSRATVEMAIKDYKLAGAETAVGLAARLAGDVSADVPLLLEWDDVRVQLTEKNRAVARLWRRAQPNQPKPTELVALRESLNQTQEEAAKSVFLSSERWRDYEDGLPMPIGLYHLYQLQAGAHPTHELQPLKERRVDANKLSM